MWSRKGQFYNANKQQQNHYSKNRNIISSPCRSNKALRSLKGREGWELFIYIPSYDHADQQWNMTLQKKINEAMVTDCQQIQEDFEMFDEDVIIEVQNRMNKIKIDKKTKHQNMVFEFRVFLLVWLSTKDKVPNLPYYLTHSCRGKKLIHTFPRGVFVQKEM